MNVEPSAACIVDPSPPVVALGELGEGVDPLGPPDFVAGPPEVFDLVAFTLGLITVKYTGTITATTIKATATKTRRMRITERRLVLGDGVVRSSALLTGLSASNVPESFGVVASKYDSRGESEVEVM